MLFIILFCLKEQNNNSKSFSVLCPFFDFFPFLIDIKEKEEKVGGTRMELYFVYSLLGGLFCHQSSRVKLSDIEEKVVKTKLETRPENLFSHF